MSERGASAQPRSGRPATLQNPGGGFCSLFRHENSGGVSAPPSSHTVLHPTVARAAGGTAGTLRKGAGTLFLSPDHQSSNKDLI